MNVYLARLKALNLKTCHPDQPSKPSKPSFEDFDGDPSRGVLKNNAWLCAQCGGGPSTDPPTDAPTIRVADVWLHPECCRFYRGRPE